MQKTAVVSAETLRNLIEANASLAAWYYELWRALREGGPVNPPDESRRAAYVKHLSREFPELAQVASTIEQPRLYVPRPVVDIPPLVSSPGNPGPPTE
jgi:hypothetical protein